jgi:hypothetical protein
VPIHILQESIYCGNRMNYGRRLFPALLFDSAGYANNCQPSSTQDIMILPLAWMSSMAGVACLIEGITKGLHRRVTGPFTTRKLCHLGVRY